VSTQDGGVGATRPVEIGDAGTRILTRADIQPLLVRSEVLDDVASALIDHSVYRHPGHRVRADLPSDGTALVLFPGLMRGVPAYTVKVNAKFPGADPAIRGVICLHDLSSGALLSLLDSSLVTAVRTGAAGALAAHALAATSACEVAVVGAGVQGREMLRHLAELRAIPSVRAFDIAPARARAFADEMSRELGVPTQPMATLQEATHDAGIVLVATWARRPLLWPGLVAGGTHVSSLGADEPGKAEVAPALIRLSRFFCDDVALATSVGAVGNVGPGPEQIAGEIGDVLAGRSPGRTNPDEVTIFAGVGLPAQDLAVAWRLYGLARDRGAGTVLSLHGTSER
jgi:ornithine cyclodeaminase/alanine dehydrogenase-like protein (mu-crystallin family)